MKPSDLEQWMLDAASADAVTLRVRQAAKFGHAGKVLWNLPLNGELTPDKVIERLEENRATRNLSSAVYMLEALDEKKSVVQEDRITIGQETAEEMADAKAGSDLASVMRSQDAIVAKQSAMIDHLLGFTTTNMQHVVTQLATLNEKLATRIVEQDAQQSKLVEDTLELAQLKQEREAAQLESAERRERYAQLVGQGLPVIASIAGKVLNAPKAAKIAALLKTLVPAQREALWAFLTPEQRVLFGDILEDEGQQEQHVNGEARS